MNMLRTVVTTAVVAALAGAAPVSAAWPERTVRIIVSNAPGGPTDALARILASELSPALNGTVIVENRPGAASNIAISYVANAEPDGYTLLMTTGAITINPALSDKVTYNTLTSFEPISLLATSPLIIASAPKLGLKSMADLIKLAKEKPDSLNFSSPGRATAAFIAAEVVKANTGISMAHVSHTGAGLAAQALLTGSVEVTSNAIESVMPLVESGKATPLAVSGERRWHALPDTPTLIELGLSDVPIEFMVGFYAPAKTPPEIVSRLSKLTQEILRRKDIVDRLKTFQMELIVSDPQVLRKRLEREVPFYREMAVKIGLKN